MKWYNDEYKEWSRSNSRKEIEERIVEVFKKTDQVIMVNVVRG